VIDLIFYVNMIASNYFRNEKAEHFCSACEILVAGVGFEPTTFGL
jgi:hypothetical protein